ncbi:hypothetical protein L5M28_01135 [Shewanella sp. SW32]|uniref:hypothetical protein n=1 Tax=unclassified Shewanella TaxID=196818 RepID=UPI0021DAF8E7|nr:MULTISPECIES: hypothetical protein [unclassified Shewanella]MCU7961197.1 hypothetical protein [Shewanella sp. SW32]MCU7969279.1 hypothetical protein [Shewanella sp. SW29]
MDIDIEDFTLDMIIAQAKAAQLKKETDAEKLPALFDKTLDALVSACEKLEAITAERDQLATQVEMLKSFISQQAIPNLLVLSTDYPQCLGIDSAITDAEELVKMAPVKCLADIRAKAIRQFVSDTNETGQLSFPDCQWLEQWRDEWLEEANKGGE